jgi:hypothetical protein
MGKVVLQSMYPRKIIAAILINTKVDVKVKGMIIRLRFYVVSA